MQRLDDTTTYDPFGWRLAALDTETDPDRRRELWAELTVWEAEEIAAGYRHVTIVHGDPDRLDDARHLTALYRRLATLLADVPERRVRGTTRSVTVTVAGADRDRVVDHIAAAARVTDERWTTTLTAIPTTR